MAALRGFRPARSVTYVSFPASRTSHPGALPTFGRITVALATTLVVGAEAPAQTTDNPFRTQIKTLNELVVNVVEFASVPDSEGQAARIMVLVDEPGTGRMFVNDMRRPLHGVSYDGA